MATTSTELIDGIVWASFVRRVAERAELPPDATPEAVASDVMCMITDRLTSGGAHRLLEGLPDAVRPLFARCATHRHGSVRELDRAQLLESVANHWGVTQRHAEQICRAVLASVRSYVSRDVADRVGQQLPADLKALWFAPLPPKAAHPSGPAHEVEAACREIYEGIERSGALPPGVDGAEAFMAVMCTLSRRLSGGEARNLLSALPNALRPLVGACMLHRTETADKFDEREFLGEIAEHLQTTLELATRLAQAVFAVVKRWLPEKDVEDVAGQLPVDLRNLWTAC